MSVHKVTFDPYERAFEDGVSCINDELSTGEWEWCVLIGSKNGGVKNILAGKVPLSVVYAELGLLLRVIEDRLLAESRGGTSGD